MRANDYLAAQLRSEGLDPSGWGNGPGDVYSPHSHEYDKVLVATHGSITFHFIDLGRDVTLNEGGRLDLPAGTTHGATVGSRGVQCLEAHMPAGSLQAEPRHLSEGW